MANETQQVYKAIAKVTKALAAHGIAKGRNNTQQNYKFRGIDDIYNALAPLLADAELCILPRVLDRTVTERPSRNGGVLFYVVADVEYDFVSAVDGSKHTVRVCGEAMDSGDKATNKAMSAAYKYACLQAFCIPTEGDNDADATTHEVSGAMSEDVAIKIKKLLDGSNEQTGEGCDAFGEAWIELGEAQQIAFKPWISSFWPGKVTQTKDRMRAVMAKYREHLNAEEAA